MGTNEDSTHVATLRELLTRAEHFPRPLGAKGHRVLGTLTRHGSEFIDGLPEGHVERIIERPDGRYEEWTGRGLWQPSEGWRLVSEQRSAIDERADAVRELRVELDTLIVPLLRAGRLPKPQVWTEVLADDLLDEETVGAAMATLPQPDSKEVARSHLSPTAFAFFRVLFEENGKRLDYQGVFLAAQTKEPAKFKGEAPDTRQQEAIRNLINYQSQGVVVRGDLGRGRRCEFWVEPAD